MDFEQLVTIAKSKNKEVKLNDKTSFGQVTVVVLTNNQKIYIGTNLKTTCNVGFCAETSVIAQMILNGETKIDKMVAIYKGEQIISPCGKCREQIYQLDHDNLNCEILLEDKIVTLRDLLPEL